MRPCVKKKIVIVELKLHVIKYWGTGVGKIGLVFFFYLGWTTFSKLLQIMILNTSKIFKCDNLKSET